MYPGRPASVGVGGNSTSGSAAASGAGDMLQYDLVELDILRDELLEAYSTTRERMLTRDQLNEIKREEFVVKEHTRQEMKKEREFELTMEIREKQHELLNLYEKVLAEKEVGKDGKKYRKKKVSPPDSDKSFHEMYTVYRDPMSGGTAEIERGKTAEQSEILQLFEVPTSSPSPVPTGTGQGSGEGDVLTPLKTAEEKKEKRPHRTKFVLKTLPGHVEVQQLSTSMDPNNIAHRKDVRYSVGHGRYSFDVTVQGPFSSFTDPYRNPPETKDVNIQAGKKKRGVGSQANEWDVYTVDNEEEAGGDASSSNPSSMSDAAKKGKALERKPSKRRDAETSARPRGYRDLDLKTTMPYVTFEAEIQVGPTDLDREQAQQAGGSITKDNILWPTCQQFNNNIIGRKIEEYIKRCWELDPQWLYVIQPLDMYNDNYKKRFIYEVKFSMPSPTHPVPRATASVFFTFEVPIYTCCKEESVKVTYVLEGSRFAHKPGHIKFQDKWLWGIISDKLRIQDLVNF